MPAMKHPRCEQAEYPELTFADSNAEGPHHCQDWEIRALQWIERLTQKGSTTVDKTSCSRHEHADQVSRKRKPDLDDQMQDRIKLSREGQVKEDIYVAQKKIVIKSSLHDIQKVAESLCCPPNLAKQHSFSSIASSGSGSLSRSGS